MKLLTFLGVGKYTSVRYVWGDKEWETDLFPEALTRWLNPSQVLVLLTEEARQHTHWANLQERLSSQVTLTPVDIPSGRSETELWDIFARLTECLNEGDKVVFDVTHAFRSIPILCLLAVAYLRVAKSVNLQAILYGAYEAKDKNNRAPVFDLTPFLSLLDWVTATDKFVKTGDARELANLLKAAHSLPWKSAGAADRSDLPRQLQGLGTTLQNLSQSLL
ncbi:MAG: TIGR02221 family CRISPR-associated protein, partial [Abditibacteriales bacterium]|nr:TIGR02221 family CRISPR-associated protein [Abditibacteriales bacterium]MDW8365480.1 TIGR02221 family CRISPR-associated protein [Abditibacteriales bacterium]